MNIVHTEASCGWGGQEIRILEESRGFIERGHAVWVLCPAESRIYEEGPKRGVPTIALPIGRKNLKGLFALRRWLKQNPVDVINTHSSTDSWLAALACQTLKNAPPIVRTRHISSPIPNNWASRWLYTKAVSHVVTTGEALRRQVIEQTGADPTRVTSVPTGIDPERFKPGDKREARLKLGLDPDTNYIGIVATLRSWKGHLYLLEAFTQLNAPGWKLLIVGDGPQREPLEKKTLDMGLANRVVFAGQQKNPEIWLQAMDIFCLPSYANEGIPQAILQAMLTRLPIITTNVGSISESINANNGIIVLPKNSQSIAKELMHLINNEKDRDNLGQKAHIDAMSNHCDRQMINRMQDIFYIATKQKNVLFITFGDRNTASTRLRALEYIPYLTSKGYDVQVHHPAHKPDSWLGRIIWKYKEYSEIAKKAESANIVIIQKRLLPATVINKIKNACRKIIYDFDDTITISQHKKASIFAARRTRTRFRAICDQSTAIIAGNQYLVDQVDNKYRDKTHLLETPTDGSKYKPQMHGPKPSISIGWIGQPTNYPYLNELEPIFEQLSIKYPETNLVVISKGDPKIKNIITKQILWTEETEAESLLEADIGIMPLPDNEWTRGKCAYKALQYMACGIPVVCSNVGANKEVVRDGIDGFVVEGSKEWLNALSTLVENHELRAKMSRSGRNRIDSKYDIGIVSTKFIEIIERA